MSLSASFHILDFTSTLNSFTINAVEIRLIQVIIGLSFVTDPDLSNRYVSLHIMFAKSHYLEKKSLPIEPLCDVIKTFKVSINNY